MSPWATSAWRLSVCDLSTPALNCLGQLASVVCEFRIVLRILRMLKYALDICAVGCCNVKTLHCIALHCEHCNMDTANYFAFFKQKVISILQTECVFCTGKHSKQECKKILERYSASGETEA